MEILPLKELKINDIQHLIEASVLEGYNFLNRLTNEWISGVNRFDKDHEQLYQIKIDGKIIGIGGINNNPYNDTTKTGRIRRFYIHPEYRRKGLGTILLDIILKDYADGYEKITLRTDNETAAKFYESYGFKKVKSETNTHEMVLSSQSS